MCSLLCTDCTTCVPAVPRPNGTWECTTTAGVPVELRPLYRLYQQNLRYNSNRPWTMVHYFRFNFHYYWYSWYSLLSKSYVERLLACTTTLIVLVQFFINHRKINNLSLYHYFSSAGTGRASPAPLIPRGFG